MGAGTIAARALELSQALVLHLDLKGRIIEANAAALRFLALEQGPISTSHTAVDFFGEESRQVLVQTIAGAGDTITHVAETSPQGHRRLIEWRLKTIAQGACAQPLMLAVGREITAYVLNEEKLLEERFNLVERNKELTCLYDIARISAVTEMPLEGLIQSIVELLPPAFQYAALASARIKVDGRAYTTAGFAETPLRLDEKLFIHGRERGTIDIFYAAAAGGPDIAQIGFLPEEQRLLRTIARQAALMIEKKLADDKKVELESQLRHADRLAKIGQLTAGVAHELNEPLGSILGFAQLAGKSKRLPAQVARDLTHIVQSALHAREIIKKLMLFSRQVPNRKMAVNLNALIAEGLSFIEPRFANSDIVFETTLESGLPDILADPSQLTQVLVNLVVNAVQAMPDGGRLLIKTAAVPEGVALVIQDSGIGMDETVLDQIFLPFFTTKEVDQGTGLGLSVVHGIVAGHGGRIEVSSRKGEGTRFDITLPIRNGGEADGGDTI
jgi:two-component system, NtrC family, sensor kinase